MRIVEIYRNGILAGLLTEENRKHYTFRYDDNYFMDDSKPAISLTLPKTQKEIKQQRNKQYLFRVLHHFKAEDQLREC